MKLSSPRITELAVLVLGCSLASCSQEFEPVAWMEVEEVLHSWVSQDLGRGSLVGAGDREIVATTLHPWKLPTAGAEPRPCLDFGPDSKLDLTVQPAHGEAFLRLSVGFDQADYRRDITGAVQFTVLGGGQTLFEVVKPFGRAVPRNERIWTQAPSIQLAGIDTLTLSTKLIVGTGPVHAAFADLEVVQTSQRARTRATTEQPNIVLIIIDTLRSDRLGCYGHSKPTSPTLDKLAERGTRFANCWASAPWTLPSTASILSGLGAVEHGTQDHDSCYLAQELDTLPEHLQRAGWTTGAFSANPLIQPNKAFDQGFETFSPYKWKRGEPIARDVITWIDSVADHRFFAYVHLTDPHQYDPGEAFHHLIEGEEYGGQRDEELQGLFMHRLSGKETDPSAIMAASRRALQVYDATIAEADAAVALIVEHIEESHLSERTLFIVTSDHGEEFLEHGMRGHAHHLHRELVGVPLIIAGPGVPQGVVVEQDSENRHILDTILARWVNPDSGVTRIDLLDQVGRDAAARRPIFSSTLLGVFKKPGGDYSLMREIHSIRTSRDFLVWTKPKSAEESGQHSLAENLEYFNFSTDAAVLNPLPLLEGSIQEQRAQALKDSLKRWIKEGTAQQPSSLTGGASTLNALRALGYAK